MPKIVEVPNISTGDSSGPAIGPLRSLYDTGKPDTYHYPQDLGTDSRMHIVKFSIYNIVPKKLGTSALSTLQSVGENLGDSVATLFTDHKFVSSDTGTKVSEVGKKGLDYAADLQSFVTPEIKKTSTEIFLYMPDTLAVNYNNQYDQTSLEELTGGANRLIGGVASIAEKVVAGDESAKNIAVNAADTYGAEVIGSTLGSGFRDLALKASGKAVNPQLQLIYRGVGFRTFQMNFIFTPKSEQESDHVSAIINAFVYSSSPTVYSDAGMYFIPPSIFSMQFLMAASDGSAENDRIFKVGQCVLEDINVDYAPNGWTAYSGGAPVQTTLTLSFKEIQILDRNRMRFGDVR